MNYLNTFSIDSNKFIYWLYNSETNETTTYTKYNNKFFNGCNVFYDENKDMLYSTDERAKDNVFMALINMKHYYARNYGTLNGFDFIEDKNLIEWKINFYEIKYNTMAKDLIKEEKEINRVGSKKEIIVYIFASIIGIGVIFLLLVALLYLYDLIYNLIF